MTRFLLIALLISTFTTGAYAEAERETTISVDALAEQMRSYFKSQCELKRLVMETAKEPAAIEAARSVVALACDCVPGEMELTVNKLKQDPAAQSLTKQQFMAAMAAPMNTCAARYVRQTVATQCRKDDKIKLNPQQLDSYCSCMETGFGRLSDAQIANESLVHYQRYQAKVKARANGQENPKFEPTVVEAVEASCKAAALQ